MKYLLVLTLAFTAISVQSASLASTGYGAFKCDYIKENGAKDNSVVKDSKGTYHRKCEYWEPTPAPNFVRLENSVV